MEKVWLTLHLFGLVFGAGSVTTAYAREVYFAKYPEQIAKRGSLPVITPLLNIGFLLMILSGLGLYLGNPARYNASPLFWFKMIAVAVLLLNHLFHNSFIRPQRDSILSLSKISDYTSLIGWYLIIILSVFI